MSLYSKFVCKNIEGQFGSVNYKLTKDSLLSGKSQRKEYWKLNSDFTLNIITNNIIVALCNEKDGTFLRLAKMTIPEKRTSHLYLRYTAKKSVYTYIV